MQELLAIGYSEAPAILLQYYLLTEQVGKQVVWLGDMLCKTSVESISCTRWLLNSTEVFHTKHIVLY